MSLNPSQCARCGIDVAERLCQKENGRFPEFCPTKHSKNVIAAAMLEMKRPEVQAFARNASVQEGEGYGNREGGYGAVLPIKPRIEETIEFARRMKYKKLGLAFCIGLRKEARFEWEDSPQRTQRKKENLRVVSGRRHDSGYACFASARLKGLPGTVNGDSRF